MTVLILSTCNNYLSLQKKSELLDNIIYVFDIICVLFTVAIPKKDTLNKKENGFKKRKGKQSKKKTAPR